MDPIKYFVVHSGLLLAVLGILTFILGLILGLLLAGNPEQKAELAAARKDLDFCVRERRDLENTLKVVRAECFGAEKHAGSYAAELLKLRSRQQTYYSQHTEGGNVHFDSMFGFLYMVPPKETDDLTEIKGVGEILGAKLNEYGVYTFRQVAVWDEDMAGRFADRLDAFKERVIWDDWIGQANDLHFKKYGERL
jgi:hypothetical protein